MLSTIKYLAFLLIISNISAFSSSEDDLELLKSAVSQFANENVGGVLTNDDWENLRKEKNITTIDLENFQKGYKNTSYPELSKLFTLSQSLKLFPYKGRYHNLAFKIACAYFVSSPNETNAWAIIDHIESQFSSAQRPDFVQKLREKFGRYTDYSM